MTEIDYKYKCRCGFGSKNPIDMDNHFRGLSPIEHCLTNVPGPSLMATDEKVHFKSATSSRIPHFEYIPLCALEDLADTYEKGHKIHGEKAFNAMQNQECLDDIEWVKNRLTHVIHHAYKALHDLQYNNGVMTEGHAGAIMFGGALLSAHLNRKSKQ